VRAAAVGKAAAGGLGRRRVQTAVTGLVLVVSVAASVLGLALAVDSHASFDHAFAAQRGADLTATVNQSRATQADLAATRHLPQVTAAAGPFPEATVSYQVSGEEQPPVTLAGRSSPGGPVDDVVLQDGHWADAPGQVVLSGNSDNAFPPGTTLTVTGASGAATLTVVGNAISVTNTADGWVVPAEITTLRAHETSEHGVSGHGAPDTVQMLYQFRSAGSDSAIRADIAALDKALPAGAVTDTESWLSAQSTQSSNIAPFVPFVVAFAIIGLVMSVLIVINVVSGAVVSGYRRIGVLKSIGFTPAQVVAAYTGQVAVPAVVGCVAGAALGNVLAAPLLSRTASAYGVGSLSVPTWVNVTVPVAMLALVGVAAVLPSIRAGRLSAVQAIATGRAPRTGRGYTAHRLLGKLALPRPVTIGLAAPFARPARTAVTLVAVLLGATAVTFAVGLTTSLTQVVAALAHTTAQPVQVIMPSLGGVAEPGPVRVRKGQRALQAAGPPQPSPIGLPTTAEAQQAIEAGLRSQPGTLRYVAQADQQVSVAGVSQQVQVTAFRGDSGWTGYAMISGHWYAGPGQADVATGFLTATGKTVGDTATLSDGGAQVQVRIVGEVLDTQNSGLDMITDWQTLAAADPGLGPDQFDVALRPGTSADAYVQALSNRLGQYYFVFPNSRHSRVVDLMITLVTILTLGLALVAGLGVLNTVVLQTRERVHDLGVFKAIGMTPRQTVAMVVSWVAGTGLVAGVVAVPAGLALHRYILPKMAAAADVGIPPAFLNPYRGWELVLLALAGIAIAVAGALLPAGWAASARSASALRAE
jgi:putative ABC transport system permease protein